MTPLVELLNETARLWWLHVFQATWQASLLACLVIVVVLLARRWPSPLRYALVLLALVKFAVPPTLSAPTAVFRWLERPAVAVPLSEVEPAAALLPASAVDGRVADSRSLARFGEQLGAEPLLAVEALSLVEGSRPYGFQLVVQPSFLSDGGGRPAAESSLRNATEVRALRQAMAERRRRQSARLERFIDDGELAQALRRIRTLSQESGLELNSLSPTSPRSRDLYVEVPLSIVAGGNDSQVGQFLSRLAQLPFAVRVEGLELEPAGGGPSALTVRLGVNLILRSDSSPVDEVRPDGPPASITEEQLEEGLREIRRVLAESAGRSAA